MTVPIFRVNVLFGQSALPLLQSDRHIPLAVCCVLSVGPQKSPNRHILKTAIANFAETLSNFQHSTRFVSERRFTTVTAYEEGQLPRMILLRYVPKRSAKKWTDESSVLTATTVKKATLFSDDAPSSLVRH
jgi:hypothetical protein